MSTSARAALRERPSYTSPLQFSPRFQIHLVAACAAFGAWCYWLPWAQGASRFWFPGWMGMLAVGVILGSGVLPAVGRRRGSEGAFAIGCLLAMFNFMYAQLTLNSWAMSSLRDIAYELRYELVDEAVCLGTLPLACALICSYPAWCMSCSVGDKSRRWMRLALLIALIDIMAFSLGMLAAFDFGAELERAAVSQSGTP